MTVCHMRPVQCVLVSGVLIAFASASPVAAVSPSATIIGTVTLTAADGGTFAGDGARVILACKADGMERTEVADEHGAFRFLSVPVDSCSLQANVQGFVAQPVTVVTAADHVIETDLHLGIAVLRVGVNVTGTTSFPPSKVRRGRGRAVAGRLERSAKGCTR
jgi:hypothetical protein